MSNKPTIAAICRDMILDGKPDNQIWSRLKQIFNFSDDDFKHQAYVQWYRCELRRRAGVKRGGGLVRR